MKMLLTSSGLCNSTIAGTLRKLVKGRIRIAFIPTAANIEAGGKDWLIKDLVNFQKLGTLDIVDISALPKDVWLPRLKKANVIAVGGGDTIYLIKWVAKSGLNKELPKLLKSRVYVGVSAGSIITAKTLFTSSDFLFYGTETKNAPKGLGFIEFNIRPHLNSQDFPKVRHKNLEKLAGKMRGDIYAIDDDSAVLVDGDKIKVISEGTWRRYMNRT